MTLEYLGVGISFPTIVFMDTRKKKYGEKGIFIVK